MLSLQYQCVSLDLAQKLSDLHYPQDYSLFAFAGNSLVDFHTDDAMEASGICRMIVAPTAAELGDFMPIGVYSGKDGGKKLYTCWHNFKDIEFGESTEADARAKMLIHLVEHGIISFAQPQQ